MNIGTTRNYLALLAAALLALSSSAAAAVHLQLDRTRITEGANEVRLRLDAVIRAKCGDMQRAPVRWYETVPMLLHKGAVETLIAMAEFEMAKGANRASPLN